MIRGEASSPIFGTCFLLACLAGCAANTPEEAPAPAQRVQPAPRPPEIGAAATLLGWRCEDGSTLHTRYESSSGALAVGLARERFVLQADRREAGASWSRDSTRVEVDGDVAVFAQGARALRCRRAPDLTSALRAASLGAVFRGQGNEPGWSVDVYPERLAWVGAWGGDRRAFSDVSVSGSAAAVRWQGRAGAHHLTVDVRYEHCVDDGDRSFPARVEATLDDQSFVGCGGPLDAPP